jgi:hypothetical protein
MATIIGSLAPGLDGYVVRLGIGRKRIRKNGKNPNFLGAPMYIL